MSARAYVLGELVGGLELYDDLEAFATLELAMAASSHEGEWTRHEQPSGAVVHLPKGKPAPRPIVWELPVLGGKP
jgi:hypothetical protein